MRKINNNGVLKQGDEDDDEQHRKLRAKTIHLTRYKPWFAFLSNLTET